MSMKNPLTPTGIEPATYRFVAQFLSLRRRKRNSIYKCIAGCFEEHSLG